MEENTEQTPQAKKDSLKVQALTQSLAHKVAQYEEQIADLRAEASMIIDSLQARVTELEKQLEGEVEVSEEVSDEAEPSDPTN